MKNQTITVTLTKAEADWLTDHIGVWWECSYSGIEEMDYILPMLTIYKALLEAGAAPYKTEPVKAVSQ